MHVFITFFHFQDFHGPFRQFQGMRKGGGGGGHFDVGQYGGGMGGGGGRHTVQHVEVPREFVGQVIGRGGETIKSIQTETGAKIQFQQGEKQRIFPAFRSSALTT